MQLQNCIRGTTVDVGDGTDAPLNLPAGGNFNVTESIQYASGDPSDIRAGWVSVDAFPLSVLAGA